MRRSLSAVCLVLLLAPACFSQNAPRHFDGQSWWAQVKVLADDKMEGRETGSAGLQRAEAYVVDQLKSLGLRPAGSNGFYQPVKFVSRQIDESKSSAALVNEGEVHPLVLGEEANFNTRAENDPEGVKSPLVFLGYGLKIPEKNYDDFQGMDLTGKIGVIIYGSPADVPSALASHYQTVAERWKSMRAAGLIGVISISNPAATDIPWARSTLARTRPSMNLAGSEFQDSAGEKLSMSFNPAHAEELFAGSGHSFAELVALARDRKPLPRFPLKVSVQAKAEVATKEVDSANVIAVYPGSDPKLKGQYVVLSAHVDHLGYGAPIDGDNLYNGAMDNASGCSVLLDIARSLAESKQKTKRSILFVFVTGEEKGLLGSKYFAARPTVERHAMVADVNVDMFLPIVPLKLITIYGLAESDLGDRASEVAKSYGLEVQPDPEPLRNVFIRSDQYYFVRHGIPALMLDVGETPGSPEAAVQKAWLTHRYHAPSDDLTQPVDLAAAGLYEDVVRALAVSEANDPRRPQWKADSFFRRFEGQ